VARRRIFLSVALLCAASGWSSVGVAQVRPDSVRRAARRDSVPLDSAAAKVAADSAMRERILARSDSVRRAKLADTLRAPLARFEQPDDAEFTPRLRFGRDQILSTGATNVADLLDRVPGVTSFRSGWIPGVHAAVFQGDAQRIRLFLDGVELDAIEARNGGVVDLTDIQLWTLDEIVFERTAGEVRVWMRSVTVTKTIPYTRFDIFTGDLNTNAFRGQLARRFSNGLSFQFGGQQVATQTGRVNALTGASGSTRKRSDGSLQAFMSRVGWARGRWSLDAFGQLSNRERDAHTPRNDDFDSLPAFRGGRRDGYVRAGFGDTTRGFWAQALASSARTIVRGDSALMPAEDDSAEVQIDTVTSRTQQLVAAGYRGSWWQASLVDRMRLNNGSRDHAPALRIAATHRLAHVGVYQEWNAADGVDRRDVRARIRPVSWLALSAVRSDRQVSDSGGPLGGRDARYEGAVRVRALWIGGGVQRTADAQFANLTLIGAPRRVVPAVAATGALFSATGRLWKDLYLDLQGIRWNGAQYNRPQTHIRAELAVVSEWRRKFPKGEFGFNARVIFDRRGPVPFSYGADDKAPELRVSELAQVLTGHLEIRIQRATLFYQYRNLTGGQYEQIRGITMPPAVQMYGVRWEFWN